MDQENKDKTASLIYFWLKDKKLLKTCKTLQEEYGNQEIIKKPKDASSLDKVIETYHAMSVLMSAFLPNNNKNPRKRKISTSQTHETEDHSINLSEEHKELNPPVYAEKKVKTSKKPLPKVLLKSSGDTEQTEAPVVEAPKKKEPFVQPGEWICPEMESILHKIYDRLPKSDLAEHRENIKPEVDTLKCEIIKPSTDASVGKEKENIIDKAIKPQETDVTMFTSDSDCDSDNENNLKKAINETLNEEPKKLSKNKRRKSKKLFPKQPAIYEANETDVTKREVDFNIDPPPVATPKKKKKKSKIVPARVEETPIIDEEKSKISDVFENESSQDSGQIDNSLNLQSTVKKKKKKNKPKLGDIDIDQSIVSNAAEESVGSEEKKKKKKKKPEIMEKENETVVEDNVTKVSPKKKKKKAKVGDITNEHVNTNDTLKTGDETLNSLGDILKKKKKKKIVDRGA